MFPDVVWIDHVIIRVSMYYDCTWVCCVHVNAGHVCVTAGMEVGEWCWRTSSPSTMILRWNSVDRPAGQAPSAAQPQCQSAFELFGNFRTSFHSGWTTSHFHRCPNRKQTCVHPPPPPSLCSLLSEPHASYWGGMSDEANSEDGCHVSLLRGR